MLCQRIIDGVGNNREMIIQRAVKMKKKKKRRRKRLKKSKLYHYSQRNQKHLQQQHQKQQHEKPLLLCNDDVNKMEFSNNCLPICSSWSRSKTQQLYTSHSSSSIITRHLRFISLICLLLITDHMVHINAATTDQWLTSTASTNNVSIINYNNNRDSPIDSVDNNNQLEEDINKTNAAKKRVSEWPLLPEALALFMNNGPSSVLTSLQTTMQQQFPATNEQPFGKFFSSCVSISKRLIGNDQKLRNQ